MSSSKKDAHRRTPATRVRIINRLQKIGALSPETARTLKQLDLTDKKYTIFIENLVTDGIIKEDTVEGIKKYWIRPEKVRPKEKTDYLTFINIFVFTLLLIVLAMFIFQIPPF